MQLALYVVFLLTDGATDATVQGLRAVCVHESSWLRLDIAVFLSCIHPKCCSACVWMFQGLFSSAIILLVQVSFVMLLRR